MKQYLKTVTINLIFVAILALIARVIFQLDWLGVFLLLGIFVIGIHTIGLVMTYLTLRNLEKELDMPFSHLYVAYVVYQIQSEIPVEKWTRPIVYYYLDFFKTTGVKPPR